MLNLRFRLTFDTHEDGDVAVAEAVGERADVVDLVAAFHLVYMQRRAANCHVVRRHDVTQTDAVDRRH